ncbi:MAG: hypothetical protein LUE12_05220 [Ruminococcus sp.]|nr:hypothetical protein [Ruminococcus sp.]
MKFLKALAVALAAALLACCSAQGNEESTTDSLVDSADFDSSDLNDDSELYDTSAISDAYLIGEADALSDFDLAIYNKVCEIFNEVVSEDMSDYEKELALHDWLIENCTYDTGSLRAIPRPSENCENPYGALIDGEAICSGYTSSFKLFMDMLEIECMVIQSTDSDGDEHAWNAVGLDGNWYYVDCTWDDPVPDEDGRAVTHKYFNISYEEMAQSHVLPNGSPQTQSVEFSFYNQEAASVDSFEEIDECIALSAEKNQIETVLLPDESFGITLNETDLPDDYYYPSDEGYDDFEAAVGEAVQDAGFSSCFFQRKQTEQGIALVVRFVYD